MPNVSRIIKAMVRIYGPVEKDWMGFKKTDRNKLAFHHINKEEDGGTYDISNGALLTVLAHRYLHEIEGVDKELYDKINLVFKRINSSMNAPREEDYKEIEAYLEEYENKFSKGISKRIKINKINMEAIRRVFPDITLVTPHDYRIVMQEGIDPKKRK